MADRDDAILAALAAGETRAAVSQASGLSIPRLDKIIAAHK